MILKTKRFDEINKGDIIYAVSAFYYRQLPCELKQYTYEVLDVNHQKDIVVMVLKNNLDSSTLHLRVSVKCTGLNLRETTPLNLKHAFGFLNKKYRDDMTRIICKKILSNQRQLLVNDKDKDHLNMYRDNIRYVRRFMKHYHIYRFNTLRLTLNN